MRSTTTLLLFALGAFACGKVDSGSPNDEPVVPGADCTPLGDTAPSIDGCNTCTCSEIGWACGEKACEPPIEACDEGTSKPAEDGCNTCTCSGGSWLCSAMPCDVPTCMDGETSSDGCNSCTCSAGEWVCGDVYCPPPCEEGTVKAAGDGCNTCSCNDGGWLCTEKACPEPECPIPSDIPEQTCEGSEFYARAEGTDGCCTICYAIAGYTYYESLENCEASKVCAPGETKYADDQCNTCSCSWDGSWACTDTECAPVYCGGLGGTPCAETEYCAYEAGQGGCGFNDANAICRPRPTACTEEEAPVCGCDGETYSNACIAAMAGTGLMADGPCEAPPPE